MEIIRFFAKEAGQPIWITKWLNPFVWLGSFVLQLVNKMFESGGADTRYNVSDIFTGVWGGRLPDHLPPDSLTRKLG